MDIYLQLSHLFGDRFNMAVIDPRYNDRVDLGGDVFFFKAGDCLKLLFQQNLEAGFWA